MLAEFIRYDMWANLYLLDYCQNLTTEQLNSTYPGTYGTIRDTLVHILRTQSFYVFLLTKQWIEPSVRWDDNPDLSVLHAYTSELGNVLTDAVSRLEPGDLVQQEWQGKTTTYKAIAVVIQLVNHCVEHRAHINVIISQLGLTPPDVDGWNYMWANADRLVEP